MEREAKSMTASVKELCDVLEEAKVLNFAAFQVSLSKEDKCEHFPFAFVPLKQVSYIVLWNLCEL